MGIASSLTDNIHRGTLTVGNLLNTVDILLVEKQSHALLRLVGNNLLSAQSFVADWKLGHIDLATTLANKLRQTVQVSGRTMVVDRNNRVVVFLSQRTDKIVSTLLHLRVGTLNGVKLNAVAVATGIN